MSDVTFTDNEYWVLLDAIAHLRCTFEADLDIWGTELDSLNEAARKLSVLAGRHTVG
jgi:hypothetical protein